MRDFQVDDLQPSGHARAAMRDRGVSWAEVVDVVRRPNITEAHEGRTRFVRGDLTVVVGEDVRRPGLPVVVTILWRKAEPWTSAAMRAR